MHPFPSPAKHGDKRNMKLFIKNMINANTRRRAIQLLESLGLHPIVADVGEVEIPDSISSKKYDLLKRALSKEDFELVNNKQVILVEKIKYLVTEMIQNSDELPDAKISDYLSDKLHLDYTYLSRCFSKIKKMNIREFIIEEKIKRVKQLLLSEDLTLSEIAWKLQYSSTSHLSSQFKKVTGVTPSAYKKFVLKNEI